jgi:hypothetical protein
MGTPSKHDPMQAATAMNRVNPAKPAPVSWSLDLSGITVSKEFATQLLLGNGTMQ